MIYTKFHFLIGKFELIDSSRIFDWDGEDFIYGDMEYMSFDLHLRDKRLSFDIIFNFEARCKYVLNRGDEYFQDTYDISDIDIDIDIKAIESNSSIDMDIKDDEVLIRLKKLILKNLNLE